MSGAAEQRIDLRMNEMMLKQGMGVSRIDTHAEFFELFQLLPARFIERVAL